MAQAGILLIGQRGIRTIMKIDVGMTLHDETII